MADGEAVAIEEPKRAGEELVESGSKRIKASPERFEEPLEPVSKENGVSRIEEEAGLESGTQEAAEVVDAVQSENPEEEGVFSDVEEEFSEGEYTEEETDEEDEEDSEGELVYGNVSPPPHDRKGKGIVIDKGKGIALDKGKGKMEDYKGKGKAIVQDEDEDSDGSEVGVEDEEMLRGHMEFVEDPLEEVDLNNILPTRTRKRKLRPEPVLHLDPPGDGDSEDDEDYIAGSTGGD